MFVCDTSSFICFGKIGIWRYEGVINALKVIIVVVAFFFSAYISKMQRNNDYNKTISKIGFKIIPYCSTSHWNIDETKFAFGTVETACSLFGVYSTVFLFCICEIFCDRIVTQVEVWNFISVSFLMLLIFDIRDVLECEMGDMATLENISLLCFNAGWHSSNK